MLISTAQVLSGSEDVYVVCVKTTNSMYSLRQVILFGYNCIFVSLSGASTSLLLGLGLALSECKQWRSSKVIHYRMAFIGQFYPRSSFTLCCIGLLRFNKIPFNSICLLSTKGTLTT